MYIQELCHFPVIPENGIKSTLQMKKVTFSRAFVQFQKQI